MPRLHRIRPRFQALTLIATLFLVSLSAGRAKAQPSPDAAATTGHLVLVLPFDNRSGQSNLAWIGDSFPDTLDRRLNSAGFLTITRDDRVYALDHLGLPTDFKPTRATTIRIAQTLDADYVVVGSYNITNGRISVQAQVLAVGQLRMSAPLEDSAELPRLFDVENAIAWKVARQIDPQLKIAEQTFLAAGGVKLSSFESYIRGISAPNPQERIKRLEAAVQETPNYSAALLALGKAQYAQLDYEHAAATLAKVPLDDRLALEANFYLGLARFNLAKYADAESAFTFVAGRLPLPEVVNNQGVAATRQGQDGVALFQRSSAADPADADYHYNLAVSFLRRGDFAAAQTEIDAALKLRPNDSDATQLRTRIAAGRNTTAAAFDPLERIRRTYSEASFRQAAFLLDQVRAARMAALPPADQAKEYIQLGQQYLGQGLVPEAEQQFESAIAAQPNSSLAHAGLALVRERSASAGDARTEAQTSIRLAPNANAYLVLARLDMSSNNLAAAASDVGNALRLEPRNAAAQAMKLALQQRDQSLP